MGATTKKTEATGVDYSTLNVWAKLLGVRSEFYGAGAKKTGRNIHAESLSPSPCSLSPSRGSSA